MFKGQRDPVKLIRWHFYTGRWGRTCGSISILAHFIFSLLFSPSHSRIYTYREKRRLATFYSFCLSKNMSFASDIKRVGRVEDHWTLRKGPSFPPSQWCERSGGFYVGFSPDRSSFQDGRYGRLFGAIGAAE